MINFDFQPHFMLLWLRVHWSSHLLEFDLLMTICWICFDLKTLGCCSSEWRRMCCVTNSSLYLIEETYLGINRAWAALLPKTYLFKNWLRLRDAMKVEIMLRGKVENKARTQVRDLFSTFPRGMISTLHGSEEARSILSKWGELIK